MEQDDRLKAAYDFLGAEPSQAKAPTPEMPKELADAYSFLDTAPPSGYGFKDAGGDVAWAAKRGLGYAVGAMNAPHAFAMGGFRARQEDPVGYDAAPYWKQTLIALGGGFKSAWESISKEGKWGADVDDFMKDQTGKSIEEHLPSGAKWAAPTVKAFASMALDPMIPTGIAQGILTNLGSKAIFGKEGMDLFNQLKAVGKVPAPVGATLPQSFIDDVRKLEKLDEAEKTALKEQLLGLLSKREDHLAWREEIKRNPPIKVWQSGRNPMEGMQPPSVGETITKPTISPTAPQGHGMVLQPGERQALDISQEEIAREVAEKQAGMWKPTPNPLEGIGPVTPEKPEGFQRISDAIRKATGLGEEGAIRIPRRNQSVDLLKQNPYYQKMRGAIGEVKKDRMTLGEAATEGYEKILDRFIKIKGASPAAYEQVRKYSAHRDIAGIELEELADRLKPVRNEQELFDKYVFALRSKVRADLTTFDQAEYKRAIQAGFQDADAKVLASKPVKNPGNVTKGDADNYIREAEQAYAQVHGDAQPLRDSAQAFHEWSQKYILDDLHEAGFISDNVYLDTMDKHPFYAAFSIIDKLPEGLDKLPRLASPEYFSVANQKVFKALKGTEKQTLSPVQATLEKFIQTKSLIARNRAVSTFVDDVLTNPNSPLAGQMARVAENPKQFGIFQNQGFQTVMEGQIPKGFDTLNRFKDGRVEKYIVPKEYADAMKQMTPWQAPKVLQGLNAVFREAATTAYLPFSISNAMRDALMAYNTSPVYKPSDLLGKFQLDWMKGLIEGTKHEFGKSAVAKEYFQHGGGMGFSSEVSNPARALESIFAPSAGRMALNVAKSPLELIRKITGAIELAPRLGVYERALKMGQTADEAAMLARTSTIDFAKSGSYTKVANQFIPFFNARIQGRDTVRQAFQNDFKNTAAKVFMSTVAPGMGLYAINRMYNSDLYDDIPENVKQNYFTFITGTDEDKYGRTVPKYVTIAKGDLGQMVWNPIEYAMDRMWEHDRIEAGKFLANFASDLSPVEFARNGELAKEKLIGGVLPPAVKGVAEDISNLNYYTGRKIEPEYGYQPDLKSVVKYEDIPAHMRYTEKTPEIYKKISSAMSGYYEMSPLRIQNYASNIVAGYGRTGLDPAALGESVKSRFLRSQGGAKEEKAWDVYEELETQYNHTRTEAQRLIAQGEIRQAQQLMTDWNRELKPKVSEMERYGFKDKGGIMRDFTFTNDRRKGLITGQDDQTIPALERRLQYRRR